MSNLHRAAIAKVGKVRQTYQGELVEIGGEPFTAVPVSFRSDRTEKAAKNEFKRQNFIFPTGTVTPTPGLIITWGGNEYEVVRDREGSFYYDDEYQLYMVVMCVKRETIGPS